MAIARTVIKISFHLSKFFHIKIASPKKMTIKIPLAVGLVSCYSILLKKVVISACSKSGEKPKKAMSFLK